MHGFSTDGHTHIYILMHTYKCTHTHTCTRKLGGKRGAIGAAQWGWYPCRLAIDSTWGTLWAVEGATQGHTGLAVQSGALSTLYLKY